MNNDSLCIKVTLKDGSDFGLKLEFKEHLGADYDKIRESISAQMLGQSLMSRFTEYGEAAYEYISDKEYDELYGDDSEEVQI